MYRQREWSLSRWIALGCVLGLGCVFALPALAAPTLEWRVSQEDQIRTAALKYHIAEIQKQAAAHKPEEKNATPSVVFLGESRQGHPYEDVSEPVMKVFADLDFVKRFSQSHLGQNNCPTDNDTGERGSLLYTGKFHWINDKEVNLEGGSEIGFPGSRGWTWHLTWEEGKWVVKSERQTSVG